MFIFRIYFEIRWFSKENSKGNKLEHETAYYFIFDVTFFSRFHSNSQKIEACHSHLEYAIYSTTRKLYFQVLKDHRQLYFLESLNKLRISQCICTIVYCMCFKRRIRWGNTLSEYNTGFFPKFVQLPESPSCNSVFSTGKIVYGKVRLRKSLLGRDRIWSNDRDEWSECPSGGSEVTIVKLRVPHGLFSWVCWFQKLILANGIPLILDGFVASFSWF